MEQVVKTFFRNTVMTMKLKLSWQFYISRRNTVKLAKIVYGARKHFISRKLQYVVNTNLQTSQTLINENLFNDNALL